MHRIKQTSVVEKKRQEREESPASSNDFDQPNALCWMKCSACSSESAIAVSSVRLKRRCSWLLLPAAAAAADDDDDEDDDDEGGEGESTNKDHA